MTVDHRNSPHNVDKFLEQPQTKLSQKPKLFPQFFYFFHLFIYFLHFQNLHKILHILKKQISFITEISWKLFTAINVVNWTPESSYFRTPFGNQRFHGPQTLTNSEWPDFHPNFWLIKEKIKLENISLSQIWDPRTVL